MTKVPTLNLTDLVSDVYREYHHLGVSKSNIDELARGIFDTILTRVSRGEPVSIRNFGTFAAKLFKGRELHTPLMSEKAKFPDMLILRFKQSTTAKAAINERAAEYAAKRGGPKKLSKKIAAAPAVEGDDTAEVPAKRGRGRPPKTEAKAEAKPAKTKKVKAVDEGDDFEHSTSPEPKGGKKGQAAIAAASAKPKKAKKEKEPVEEVEEEIEDLDVDDDEIEDLDDSDDDEIEDLDDSDDDEEEEEKPAPKKKAKK